MRPEQLEAMRLRHVQALTFDQSETYPVSQYVEDVGALLTERDRLAAALSVDAPRLSREIIAQRVAALTDAALSDAWILGSAACDSDGDLECYPVMFRRELLRALTEEPTP